MKAKQLCGWFTLLWILSWFSAIWIFHLEFFLTGIFAFVLACATSKVSEDEKKYCTKCGCKLDED